MATFTPNGPSRPGRLVTPTTADPPVSTPRPHPWELLLHPFRTLRFVNALRRDPRVPFLRKLLYVGPIAALLLALLMPEGIVAAAVSVLLPVIGPAISLPADAAVDWLGLAVAAYGLLGILPQAIVAEQHGHIFHPKRASKR